MGKMSANTLGVPSNDRDYLSEILDNDELFDEDQNSPRLEFFF